MKRLKAIGLIAIVILVLLGNFPISAIPPKFNKNIILDDYDFDYQNTLTEREIQDLFEGKGQWKGKKGRSFLADYIDPVTGKSANQVIAEISEKYQISSQVLLSKIQVESSSIWYYKNMNQLLYYKGEYMGTLVDWLLGFGWTDEGPIPKYAGFYNQVENAAKLLATTFQDPSAYKDIDGKVWSVNEPHRVKEKTVDNKTILIEVIPENSSTVALYIYTPWIGEADPTTTKDDFGNKLLYNVWLMMFGADRAPTEEMSKEIWISPAEVVKIFWNYIITSRYAKAEKLLGPETLKVVRERGGLKKIFEDEEAVIVKVKVEKDDEIFILGEEFAVVSPWVIDASGRGRPIDMPLRKINGKWKITDREGLQKDAPQDVYEAYRAYEEGWVEIDGREVYSYGGKSYVIEKEKGKHYLRKKFE